MTTEEAKTPWASRLYRMVNGVNIPAFFANACGRPLEEHLNFLKVMDLRPDDVIITAFAKSGTHFTFEITSMLLAGRAEYTKRSKMLGMIEASDVETLRALPSPRVLNSHLPVSALPAQIKERKVKVVHLYRNCKDVTVSGYFHVRQLLPDVTLEEVERTIVGPGVPGGDYFSFLEEMDDFRKDNPDVPFFTMSYEDMREDPQKAIGKLAAFLEVEASPQLIRDIMEATSINKLREADMSKERNSKIPHTEVFRKGQVGDWKNYLTVAQSERLDAAMTQLQSRDYHFRYTL